MKKIKTSCAYMILPHVITRAKQLHVTVCILNDDFDYTEIELYGDNANIVADEINSGIININF